MEGDPRNPRISLLKKYDIPVEHLSYEYLEKCSTKKELERIIRILRSGEEGFYPDLLKLAEERLRLCAPDSRVLRVETPILKKESLTKEEWDAVESELLSWEKEMNVIDKSLDFEKGRIEIVGNKNMPEVRKTAQFQQKKKNQDSEQPSKSFNNVTNVSSNSNNRRIKSGDYAAWDKFDVDRELLRLDVQEEREREENEKMKRMTKKSEKNNKIQLVDVDKENYSKTEQEVLAGQAKDRGNECYKSGDMKSALKYYEISINLYPSANAYNNRALAYLKLKQYEKCVEDCNKVLDLEKNNVKALHRRATAYQNMSSDQKNDYNQLALQDLYNIVFLEPNNKVAQLDLQKLKKKLNVDDLGKKFRMPISEEVVIKENKNIKKENNSTQNITDTENLPLLYYGPSTSTFRCEPYSMIHRALSGSSIPGQVLCKCNSDRTRQNPLCQRCGEAMSTPKPIKKVSKKENESKKQETEKVIELNNKTVDTVKPETKNNILVDNKEKLVELENSSNKDNKINLENVEKPSVNCSDISLDKKTVENNLSIVQEVSPSITGEDLKSENTKENNVKNPCTDQKDSSQSDVLKNIKSLDHETNNIKITENNSSQDRINQNTKKHKSKKNKSHNHKDSKIIESTKIEPAKVLHAPKYLNPTSVEPKIKKEPSKDIQQERNTSSTVEFKAFVPNRKCLSTEIVTPTMDIKKTTVENNISSDLSREGNKENICEKNSNITIGNTVEKNELEEIKNDFVDSAFEFMKTWEELKKFDESYIKRAEILRKIRPNDLSKVIGVKLDSDMLSCFLECLVKHFAETEPKRVAELLKQLPEIPRFGLVNMFLGDADKKKMNELVKTIEAKGFPLEDHVKKNLAIRS